MFSLVLYLIGCGFLWVILTLFDPKTWSKAKLLRVFIFFLWLWWTYFAYTGGIANLVSKIGNKPCMYMPVNKIAVELNVNNITIKRSISRLEKSKYIDKGAIGETESKVLSRAQPKAKVDRERK